MEGAARCHAPRSTPCWSYHVKDARLMYSHADVIFFFQRRGRLLAWERIVLDGVMRKANLFRHESALPRMSWSPRNLYNLIARSTNMRLVDEFNFTKTSMTMYQQRWRSKRLLRGYHGDWIPERRFKRWFLPSSLPSYAPEAATSFNPRWKGDEHDEHALDTPTPPIKSLFLRDVERRLDTVVFRCCFAHSVYYARSLVLHGKVHVNGEALREPGYLLQPGDLISVEPSSVPMLNEQVAKRVKVEQERYGLKKTPSEETDSASEPTPAQEEAVPEVEAKPASDKESDAVPDESKEEQPPKDAEPKEPSDALPAGVLPFHLPPFAAPFLFIPPYLDVSFRTCSAIYLRHPTLSTTVLRSRHADKHGGAKQYTEVAYRSDIPSPYPANADMFGLVWELYVRNAPRVRSDERRTKLLGRFGRNGFMSARAFEQDRRRVAIRRGWGRKRPLSLPQAPSVESSTQRTST